MKHLILLAVCVPLVACNAGTETPYPATATPQVQTIITNGQVLTIARSADEYAAHGSVSIMRTKAGLANAELLRKEIDALVMDLNNQNSLGVLP